MTQQIARRITRRASLACLALSGTAIRSGPIRAADKVYGPGVTDTEIKIGSAMPYSGPQSAFGVVGRAATAYYNMINDQGGVNGRKINCISLDNASLPPKTVEVVRRLVEQDEVLGMIGMLGSAPNAAVQPYLNKRKVPHFFIFGGNARFRDPQGAPWSIGIDLAFVNQTAAFTRYILAEKPDAKIAVLYQNDDLGKDHLAGVRAALGDKADTIIVKTASYETTDSTLDTQVIQLKESGADALVTAAGPRFAALAIRKMNQIGWKPLHLLGYPGASIGATFKPAGLEASTGIVTAAFLKQPGDPAWANDPEMIAFLAFLKTRAPDLNPSDIYAVFGYFQGATIVQFLSMCGDNLTREALLDKITHLHQMTVPMLLPGITLSTSPDDYTMLKKMQLQRFDGTGWVNIGGIVEG